jgi:peptidoglycan/xylan/chitin deacetylase (PgdA/CDA1 family)
MAIPEKFKNLANAVRNEIYGKDVREAIATSIEETGSSSENAIKITEQLIDGSFDEGVLNTEIERKLNELEEEYAPELNSVKSQLAQTEDLARSAKRNYNTRNPVFALIDDDGRASVYTKLKPMLDSRGLKGTLGIATSFVDTSGYLTTDQILELKNNGWEMVNHAHTNVRLADVDEATIRDEFEQSQNFLQSLGINTDVFVYPGGSYNKQVVDIATEYFNVAVDDWSGNNDYPLSTYSIKRIGVGPYGENDLNVIKQQIDRALERNELCVLMTHIGQHDEAQDMLLEDTLDYILENGGDFRTFSEAYKDHQNILDYGEFDEEANQMSFAISVDGIMGGYEAFTRKMIDDAVANDTVPKHFDKGYVYYCRITWGNRTGFPTDEQGLLITNTMGYSSNSLNIYQEYHTSAQRVVYRRHAIGLTTWSNWESVGGLWTTKRPMDAPSSDYDEGINITYYTNNESTFNGGGTLVTYKSINNSGYIKQEFYSYHSTDIYIRTGTPNGWSEWSPIGIPIAQNGGFDSLPSAYSIGMQIDYYTNAEAGNSPSGSGGTLTTVMPHSDPMYSYQQFNPYSSPDLYIRTGLSDTEWGDWSQK